MTLPIALTIAGSDSGGGAGIQADLKTFQQFGVYGTSVVVAITAQNTLGVSGVHTIPVPMVRDQITAVVGDLRPAAVKSGMLGTAELVVAVAEEIARHAIDDYVLDPVMVATSGDRLLDRDAERTLRQRLIPLARVVTPNLEEAQILTETTIETIDDMEAAGRAIVSLGAAAALVKGGHLAGDELTDILVTEHEVHRFSHRRIETTSTHGTGCTLSAAIAAGLASGRELLPAVSDALEFVHEAIAAAPGLGRGHGPVNHMVGAPLPK